MPEPRRPGGAPPEDLDRALSALRERVALPPTPAIATAVRRRLDAELTVRRTAATRPSGRSLRALVPVVALVVLVTAVLAFSPAARTAVARWLGIRGIRITVVPTSPATPTPPDSPGDLFLGRSTTLSSAVAAVDYEVPTPARSGLGQPDDVFLHPVPTGGRITLAYRPRAGLPEAAGTGYGAMLSMFRGRLDEDLIAKTVHEGALVEPVTIDGEHGYWIGGDPHVLRYIDRNGYPREDTVRLAANTLVWERDGVTLRLETALPKPEALRIARSVR